MLLCFMRARLLYAGLEWLRNKWEESFATYQPLPSLSVLLESVYSVHMESFPAMAMLNTMVKGIISTVDGGTRRCATSAGRDDEFVAKTNHIDSDDKVKRLG